MLPALALLLAELLASCQSSPLSGRKPRVLVYTVSAGYEHEVARRGPAGEPCLVEQALAELGESSGLFEAVATRDPAMFELSRLSEFDLVFFYTSGELPLSESQLSALIQFVRDGGGFAGSHCASDTLYQQPAYGEMLGAYFDGHPWHQRVRIRVEDRAHPATLHLGREFEMEDEIYQFRDPYDRESLRVLLSLDTSSVDLRHPDVRRTDGDFALAWYRSFGAGRVFYTALGHRPEVWRDGRFRKHLLGGCAWAMSGT